MVVFVGISKQVLATVHQVTDLCLPGRVSILESSSGYISVCPHMIVSHQFSCIRRYWQKARALPVAVALSALSAAMVASVEDRSGGNPRARAGLRGGLIV